MTTIFDVAERLLLNPELTGRIVRSGTIWAVREGKIVNVVGDD